jgi:hypothetical protein
MEIKMFNFKTKNQKLNNSDVVKFYTMKEKLNPISDIIGVFSKNFNETLKYVKKKYDNNKFTILANSNTSSIIVVKEDFIEKYLIIKDLDELINSNYKFRRYM